MLIEWLRRNDKPFSEELTDYLFSEKPIAELEKNEIKEILENENEY